MAARPPLAPTIMPGSVPVRLAVDGARLDRLAGSPDLAAAARDLLHGVRAQISAREALFWGQALQERHGALVSERLALLQDPALREVALHLGRLRDLLLRFDLEAMTAPRGIVGGLMRHVSGAIDTAPELRAARAEIDRLLAHLAAGMEPLAALKARLDANAAEGSALADQVAAAEIAAAYLAETAALGLTATFRERRQSLATTLVQLRQAQAEHLAPGLPERLIQAIQALALVALPAWAEDLARFQARLGTDHRPSLTEARDLTFALTRILPLFPKE